MADFTSNTVNFKDDTLKNNNEQEHVRIGTVDAECRGHFLLPQVCCGVLPRAATPMFARSTGSATPSPALTAPMTKRARPDAASSAASA